MSTGIFYTFTKIDIMEKVGEIVNNLYTNTQEYVELQAKSAKLEIYERITTLISSGITGGFIALFGLFSFLFINFGFAYYLSDKFDSRTMGFFSVGGFYFLVLGLYILIKDRVSKNKIKNAILLKVSKTMDDFDQLLKEQDIVHAAVAHKSNELKQNFTELKDKIQEVKDDVAKFKGKFIKDENATVGPKIPRAAMTSVLDFVLKNIVLKNSGFLIRNVIPVVANTLLTSMVFNEDKKTSLVENIKLKISKFL